jgi:phage-related protein
VKHIVWLGSTRDDVSAFPADARQDAGHQLWRVQNGLEPDNWKPMATVGPGVREIRISDDGRAFRVMYVANIGDKVFVLHGFEKKTQKTGQRDIELARKRFKAIGGSR